MLELILLLAFYVSDRQNSPDKSSILHLDMASVPPLKGPYATVIRSLLCEPCDAPLFFYDIIQWNAFIETKSGRLSEKHTDILMENHAELVELLVLEDVVDFLISDEIVSNEQWQIIENQRTESDSARKLLSVVRRRGEAGYYSLCRALLVRSLNPCEYLYTYNNASIF